MGKQELDVLVHTFLQTSVTCWKDGSDSRLSIALKMGGACSGGRNVGTGRFVCAGCFVMGDQSLESKRKM